NRLGLSARAADLNPVAVLLNRCNLQLAPRWSGRAPINAHDRNRIGGTQSWRGTDGLAADVRYYGKVIGGRALTRILHLYPRTHLPTENGGGQAPVVAWIWARTVASPNLAARGKHVPLVSSFILSSKNGSKSWIEIVRDSDDPDGWKSVVHRGNLSPAD